MWLQHQCRGPGNSLPLPRQLETQEKKPDQDEYQWPTKVRSPTKHPAPPSMNCVPRICSFWHRIRSVVSRAGIKRESEVPIKRNLGKTRNLRHCDYPSCQTESNDCEYLRCLFLLLFPDPRIAGGYGRMSHWSASGSSRKSNRLSNSTAKRLSGGDILDQMIQELQHVILSGGVELVRRRTKDKPRRSAQVGKALGPKERIG